MRRDMHTRRGVIRFSVSTLHNKTKEGAPLGNGGGASIAGVTIRHWKVNKSARRTTRRKKRPPKRGKS